MKQTKKWSFYSAKQNLTSNNLSHDFIRSMINNAPHLSFPNANATFSYMREFNFLFPMENSLRILNYRLTTLVINSRGSTPFFKRSTTGTCLFLRTTLQYD